ncbi:MAG: hypothetical protein HRU03_08680 [Nanoarchaeales archaeon]|nr:hypothetical protein [Nanoarchaeales archaeon]
MTSQVNLRMNDRLLETAKTYAEDYGYDNLQDFIRETIREKVFSEPKFTDKDLQMIADYADRAIEKGDFISEKEAFKQLGFK